MIKMPYEEIVEKIVSESNTSKEDVETKINDKMSQLSGLISKEGAAHIVANELNIKLFTVPEQGSELKIKEVFPGLRNITLAGKVTRNFGVREFQVQDRSGKVGNILVGDETGNIKIVIWGTMADKLTEVKEGDIVKITSGYSKENNGFKEIHLNDKSTLDINPEGVEITEVKAPASASVTRKKISELQANDNNIEILGTLVDLFDIRFFEVCGECNRRVKEDTSFKCSEHPDAQHTYSYVLNGFLDDGSDNIRLVLFRERIEELLQKSRDEVLAIRESPESFAQIKTDLLGSIIKVAGKVNKNDMFDRLEFMVNSVNLNPDPDKEVEKKEESSSE